MKLAAKISNTRVIRSSMSRSRQTMDSYKGEPEWTFNRQKLGWNTVQGDKRDRKGQLET